MWKRFTLLAGAVVTIASCISVAERSEKPPSILIQMYQWSNAAMLQPAAYTEQDYARYYTSDAVLVIDGVDIVRGLSAFAQHFNRIKASGARVQTGMPFEMEVQSGNIIYTYHVIRSVRAGEASCMLAAGHAKLRDGKIALLSLVRTRIDPTNPVFADKCRWEER
jgi:ketosteroid isomerase-like protein